MKNKYYVSVQAKRVMENKGDGPFEFEIVASPEEVQKLENIFAMMENADLVSYWSSHIPYIPYHLDEENDRYDYALKMAYQTIYDLGTEETKQHILSMDVLQ